MTTSQNVYNAIALVAGIDVHDFEAGVNFYLSSLF
jgi:hypothetical protein